MAVAGVGALCGTGRFQLGNSKPAPPPRLGPGTCLERSQWAEGSSSGLCPSWDPHFHISDFKKPEPNSTSSARPLPTLRCDTITAPNYLCLP